MAIEGFAPDKYEYDVNLTDTQIARASAPWVGYSAFDNGVKVEVTDPVEFPGVSTVKVTASDNKTSVTYTINYKADNADMIDLSWEYKSTEGGKIPLKIITLGADTSQIMSNRTLGFHISPQLYGKTFVTFGSNMISTTISMKRGGNVSTYDTGSTYNKQTEAKGWKIDETGWDDSAEYNWANDVVCDNCTDSEKHHVVGACYCILDSSGNCTGKSRIGNGLDEIPKELWKSNSDVSEEANGTKYDIRTQGWFSLDYRALQSYRSLGFSCFNLRATKHFDADVSQTYTAAGLGFGTPITIDWDNWEPAVNPDADLAL